VDVLAVLLHCKSDEDIFVVSSLTVSLVTIGKKDSGRSLTGGSAAQIFDQHGVAFKKFNLIALFGVVQVDLIHVVGFKGLQDNGVPLHTAVVRMKQFYAYVLKTLQGYLSCDDYMRYLDVELVYISFVH